MWPGAKNWLGIGLAAGWNWLGKIAPLKARKWPPGPELPRSKTCRPADALLGSKQFPNIPPASAPMSYRLFDWRHGLHSTDFQLQSGPRRVTTLEEPWDVDAFPLPFFWALAARCDAPYLRAGQVDKKAGS